MDENNVKTVPGSDVPLPVVDPSDIVVPVEASNKEEKSE